MDEVCDCGAGDTVAAGVERGTRDEEIRFFFFNHGEDGLCGFFQILVEPGVAADDGGRDLGFIAEVLCERKTRAYVSFTLFGREIGHVFAADLAEELVNVMNDFKFAHLILLTWHSYD